MSSAKKKMTSFSKLKMTAQASLDADTTKEMSKCLVKLTTSGNPSLDDVDLKKFKKFCRKSDDYVRYAFILIMEQLEKKHSEIRLSAFQVAAEIFSRSHAFREILITHLQDFLTLTTGTETNLPLPPPKATATKLMESTLRTMQQWHDSFGKSYRKLAVGYNYLKNCKHVDFQNIQAQNEAERMRTEQEALRKQKQMADRLAKVLKDIAEGRSEIEDCVKGAENCLALLLPTPENFLFSVTEDEQNISNLDLSIVRSSPEGEDSINRGKCKLETSIDMDGNKDVEKEEHQQPTVQSVNEEKKNETNVKSFSKSSHVEEIGKASEQVDNGVSVCSKSISSSDFEQRSDRDALDRSMEEAHKNDEDSVSFNGESEEDENYSDASECDRAHGFSKPGYSINIEMPIDDICVKETDDNTDVLQSLKDSIKLINNSFLPRVTKWLEVLGKNGATQVDIKTMIDLKLGLETIRSKCTDLKLISMEKTQNDKNSDDDDDDDDLEDVPEKEGYEATVSNVRPNVGFTSHKTNEEKLKPFTPLKRQQSTDSSTSSLDPNNCSLKKSKSCGPYWNLKDRETLDMLDDPTSRVAALARIQATSIDSKPSTSSGLPSTSASAKSVPFVEFGSDLAYWENPNQIEAPSIIKFDSLHRFWNSGEKETEKASQHDVALMLNRTFNYTGQFEPVKWSCRAPLANGKLCPRMDRVKCPFHGRIIPRDDDGKPSAANEQGSSSSAVAETQAESKSELQPWQDPELQREIEQATGHDLGSARSQKLLDKALPKGKGKGKSRKKSGLTDIKAASNTSRKRLEKRIFNKGAMRRVCSNLDAADFKRVRDKFGNQFNYSLR